MLRMKNPHGKVSPESCESPVYVLIDRLKNIAFRFSHDLGNHSKFHSSTVGEHSCVKWPLKAKSVAPFDRALLVVCTVTRWSYICISTSIICFFLYLSLFDLCIQPRVFSSSYYSAMRCDWISRKQIICPVGCNKDGRFLLLIRSPPPRVLIWASSRPIELRIFQG